MVNQSSYESHSKRAFERSVCQMSHKEYFIRFRPAQSIRYGAYSFIDVIVCLDFGFASHSFCLLLCSSFFFLSWDSRSSIIRFQVFDRKHKELLLKVHSSYTFPFSVQNVSPEVKRNKGYFLNVTQTCVLIALCLPLFVARCDGRE